MKVEINKVSTNQIEVEIEVPGLQMDSYFELTASELSKDMKVDGFRPGKVPVDIVEREVGSQKLYDQAANIAIQRTLPKAITEEQLEVVGQPDIVVIKIVRGNAMKYKAKFATIPEIELGEYKGLKVEKKEVKIEDKEVDKSLEYLQKSRKKEGKIPELSDKFAKSFGDFETLNQLKENIKESILQEKKMREKERIRIELVEKVAQNSKMEIHQALIDIEIDKMIGELTMNVQDIGLDFDKYLKEIKKTLEDLKKEWQEQAEKRVKIGLVLKAIAKKEKIEPSEVEVEERMNEHLKNYKDLEEVKKNIDPEALKEYTKGMLRNEKVFELLEREAKII